MPVDIELELVLDLIRRQQESIPLMDRRYPASDVEFRPTPPSLLKLLSSAPEFRELASGLPPTWISVLSEGMRSELVVYRALTDGRQYVLGPIRLKLH